MVFVKLLGTLDLLAGITLILFQYDLIGMRLFLTFAVYLAFKGFLFKGDVASVIDFAIGAYMVLMLVFPITLITYIAAFYLFQKGAFCLIG